MRLATLERASIRAAGVATASASVSVMATSSAPTHRASKSEDPPATLASMDTSSAGVAVLLGLWRDRRGLDPGRVDQPTGVTLSASAAAESIAAP